MPKYLSGRSKLIRQSELSSDRYRYLSIENAEPNLGDPLVGPSSVTAKPTPPGQQFIVVSVEGSAPGERYWIPNQGGIIPGSISVFDDSVLVGALSSITQLNFVGAAITASVSIASSNLATIRIFSPGNNQEIIFNTANEFSTSTKLKFDPSNGLLTAGDRIIVGAGGTVITTTGVGSVGIGTANPTQELHVQGDLRLTGTIYDYANQPGTNTQLLIKNNFGGLTWINQGTIRAGAGGTYTNIQFNNNAGLVDGAPNFVFDDVNSRIGIGSTQPKVLLDVLGISSFKGGTTIDNLDVTGVTTTRNLTVTGVSTVGFVTGTSAFFTGIVTATKFVGEFNASNLYVTGISTFLQKVNINSDLGVTGITTTQNLQVYQSTTLNRLNATGVSTFTTVDINGGEIDVTRIGTQNLNVSGIGTFTSQVNINNLNVTGVGTFDNIKIDTNTISTNVGNLILNSQAGTTQIDDAIFVNDSTQSISKDTGSIITQGGVGIELDLYVGGQVNLATSGGITTTGGDLYVNGDLYVSDDIFYDELFARNGYFTGIVSTTNLNVTGIATIATLGVTGLTTTRNLRVIGVGTFDGLLDANAGATIDNIQIGISADNEIDTSIGNLILDSAGGNTTLDDNVSITGNLTVSGVSTFQGNVILGNDLNTDTVTFTARVNSNVFPSTNGTLDLGGTSNRWSNIYATTFNGSFVGNADTASQVSTGTTTGITTYYPTFVDSNNSTRQNEFLYTDAGISYNPSTNSLGIGTIDPKATLDVGMGSVYISNGDLYMNGTPFIFDTRDNQGGFWSNGGTDGETNLNNSTPGGSVGFTVKLPTGNPGSFGAPDTSDMYNTVSSRHNGTEGITDFKGLVGIGNTNPGEKLQVDGNIRVGISTTSNYIAFRGTFGDGVNAQGGDQIPPTVIAYTHTFIGERIYDYSDIGFGSGEKSELLLFKGNGSLDANGPDRIRLAATGGIVFDTSSTILNGTFEEVGNSTLLSTKMILTQVGNLGIGSTNPTEKLHVIGNILASGTITANSDELLKTNIQTIPNALEKVLQLRGVEFDRIDMNGEHQIGVIAQEVEKIIPEVVYGKETKSVAYGNLVSVLIEAIKELTQRVTELENK